MKGLPKFAATSCLLAASVAADTTGRYGAARVHTDHCNVK